MGYIDRPASLTLSTTSRRREASNTPWPVVPLSDAIPAPDALAGFDTLEQAMAVVAGLSG